MPTHAHLFSPFFPVHLKAQRCGNKFQLFTTATRIITNRTHTNTRTYTRTRYLEKRAQICTPLMSFSAYLFPRRWLPPLFDSHVLSVAFSEQWQLKKKHTQAGNGFVLFSFSAFTIPPIAFHSHGSTATVRGRGKLVDRVELVDVLLFLAARTKPQK